MAIHEIPDFVQIFSVHPHTNWDAALTLGVCGIMICRLAWRPINWVYSKYSLQQDIDKHPNDPLVHLYNIVLGILLTGFFCLGITAAVVLLGIWSAEILQHFMIPQGVQRPYTSEGLMPYHG